MNATEFLKLLLPPHGVIFTATIGGNGGWRNTSHTTIDAALQHVNNLTFEHQAAYFALATYEKDKVWNENLKKWQFRTQANAQYIKSFFLDLDVDPADPLKFESKESAVKDLIKFCKKIGMPKPMVIDSGGGIHAYWPFTLPVLTTEWKRSAEKLKGICTNEKFKADRSLTSDQARVLRCLGGYNFKRGAPVKLLTESNGPYEFAHLVSIIDRWIEISGVGPILPNAPVQDAFGVGNIGATNDPLHLGRISFHCAQIGAQVACRGAGSGEKIWRAALGVAKFCEPQKEAWRAVSDGHAQYNERATEAKVINWHTGPTTCQTFHTENPALCESCPHWGEITSPAQLGKAVREATELPVDIVAPEGEVTVVPTPPWPYKRRKGGGVVTDADSEDEGVTSICPYDFYPVKILRQEGVDAQIDEHSVWRAHLPRVGVFDMDIQQSMLSDTRRLYSHLLSKGVYMSNEEAKGTQQFMSAYLQNLAARADREKLYERLGWDTNHKSFVFGDYALHADGTKHAHVPTRNITAITKGGVKSEGTLEAWKEAIKFYNRPGYEGHRFFLYAALAAPIFHMTAHKGAVMSASGESGRGKTTALMSCGSIWGNPDTMLLNGNQDGTTTNMLYEVVGTYHSFPFLIDDTTERNIEEMRKFYLNFPQGRGKERMKGHEASGRVVTWETIALTSTNTDDIYKMMASGKDVGQSLMRVIGVEFGMISPGAEAKIAADGFLRTIRANYGHAGPVMMKMIVENYDTVKTLVERNMGLVDRRCASANASAERFWTAVIAAAYTAAQIASKLGLIDFPFSKDLDWMIAHLGKQRASIKESTATPNDILAEYLDKHTRNALVISAKSSSNLDCIVLRPTDALNIRHEIDHGVIYISRSALMDYCYEIKASFRALEDSLRASGVVLNHNVQKVLGAETSYARGQVRAWRVDADKICGGQLKLVQMANVAAISKP